MFSPRRAGQTTGKSPSAHSAPAEPTMAREPLDHMFQQIVRSWSRHLADLRASCGLKFAKQPLLVSGQCGKIKLLRWLLRMLHKGIPGLYNMKLT